jgi:hypothetical protein
VEYCGAVWNLWSCIVSARMVASVMVVDPVASRTGRTAPGRRWTGTTGYHVNRGAMDDAVA